MVDKYKEIMNQRMFLYQSFTEITAIIPAGTDDIPEFDIVWKNETAKELYDYLGEIIAKEKAEDLRITAGMHFIMDTSFGGD